LWGVARRGSSLDVASPLQNTVAVVDDDAPMRQAIRRFLETEGFVTEVFDTAEAFLASGAASRAQCLVLDIRLPGLSGIELHDHLLSIGNTVPTVFITAHEDARTLGLASKGTDCLIKPFLGEALLAAVTRSIAQ
jgi:FixJ family two-component response regulator